jgi:hypothetical protein
VKWGNEADEQCRVSYQLPPSGKGKQQAATVVEGQCGSASAMVPPVGTTPIAPSSVQSHTAGGSSHALPAIQDSTTMWQHSDRWQHMNKWMERGARQSLQNYPGTYASVSPRAA